MARTVLQKLKQAIHTPATAVAIVALIVASTSTATAARIVNDVSMQAKKPAKKKPRNLNLLKGDSFKTGSLLGVDLANGTLLKADFSDSAIRSLTGAKGDKGEPGLPGKRGITGIQGSRGADGKPAQVATAWAWFDYEHLTTDGNNSTPDNWYNYNFKEGNVTPKGNTTGSDGVLTIPLIKTPTKVIELGDGTSTGGGINVAWNANITALAEVTILHNEDVSLNTRVSCFLEANKGSGSSDYDQMGSPVQTSGLRQKQVETLSLVGSINRDTNTNTTYLVRVMCQDADATTDITRYLVTSGSLSVVATGRG